MKGQAIGAVWVALALVGNATLAQNPESTSSILLSPLPGDHSAILPPVVPCCQKEKRCLHRWGHSPAGQLVHAALMPLRWISGGVLGGVGHCPSAEHLAPFVYPELISSPVETIAARIQADEANARARCCAVRYLGTINCHYWPEAEVGLVAALRCDRNECVRLEAARALANGCCCTTRTIEALNLVVSGSEKDGNPAETSERVRNAAQLALSRCVACLFDGGEPIGLPTELPPPQKVGSAQPLSDNGIHLVGLWNQSPKTSRPRAQDPVFEEAVKHFAETAGTSTGVAKTPPAPTCRSHLFGVLLQAWQASPPATHRETGSPPSNPVPTSSRPSRP